MKNYASLLAIINAYESFLTLILLMEWNSFGKHLLTLNSTITLTEMQNIVPRKRDGMNKSFWENTTETHIKSIVRTTDYDTIIVGAGITGVTLAKKLLNGPALTGLKTLSED